jgi:hypothetical protein
MTLSGSGMTERKKDCHPVVFLYGISLFRSYEERRCRIGVRHDGKGGKTVIPLCTYTGSRPFALMKNVDAGSGSGMTEREERLSSRSVLIRDLALSLL